MDWNTIIKEMQIFSPALIKTWDFAYEKFPNFEWSDAQWPVHQDVRPMLPTRQMHDSTCHFKEDTEKKLGLISFLVGSQEKPRLMAVLAN